MVRFDYFTVVFSAVVGFVALWPLDFIPAFYTAAQRVQSNKNQSELATKNSGSRSRQMYQVDWSPLEKNPADSAAYKKSVAAVHEKESREEIQNLISLMTRMSDENPKWVDGHWITALHAVHLAGTYTGLKSEFNKSREALKVADQKASSCESLAPENMMCRYARALTYGVLASIDGIVASLKFGRVMQDHLVAVEKSGVDYDFGKKGTMRANTLHALGMFRRLVPDSGLVKMTFGIRGNLKEALDYHRKANEKYKESPCSLLMTSAAEYCYGKSKDQDDLIKTSLEGIERLNQMSSDEFDESVCIRDSVKLLADRSKICDYHGATLAE